MKSELLTLHGGDRVADVLRAHGGRQLFTLCGGHIAPIFVEAKRRGIRVIDTRQEQTAAFACHVFEDVYGFLYIASGFC